MLHFRNTSDDKVLSAILQRWSVIISPPWLLKFLLWVPQSTRCTCISTWSSRWQVRVRVQVPSTTSLTHSRLNFIVCLSFVGQGGRGLWTLSKAPIINTLAFLQDACWSSVRRSESGSDGDITLMTTLSARDKVTRWVGRDQSVM